MDTIEQKDTIKLRKLTKFQKKQVLSLWTDSWKRRRGKNGGFSFTVSL